MSSSPTHTDQHIESHAPTLGAYLTGFVLALILTIIPFSLVATGWLPPVATLIGVALAGVAQILVHLRFFLHLDMSDEQRWNTIFAAFTTVILFVLVGGTLWLFYSLKIRMMIGH